MDATTTAVTTAATDQTFTFADIFKNNFLENAVTNFSIVDVAITLLISFLLGLFIYAVYKKTFNGVMYSRNFNVSLVGMAMITTLIIMGVTSNIVLSLGMVGALSIVRFRSAIKDPMDIVFIFWAIAAGIVSGAGQYLLAISGSIVVGIMLIIFTSKTTNEIPYMVVANCNNGEAERMLLIKLAEHVKRMKIKSKAVRGGQGIELTVEVRLRVDNTDFVNTLAAIEGVNDVVLVSYNGELAV
ncbi:MULTISPECIES: DUF4956 domain-containing protein [Dehalobacter]|uniref:DUF4956 domain-containing protein n=2 Tax=Dehalobacter restrictus TaxID=55583 RepID=A0A857DEM2_9FIRM|nr:MULTISPECIES: DUF4956 domain-containing protein [Dehalobacter]AHF08809.1 membrane protein [Dehalobacter restrictus DSM 9455]MCG1024172.1 DUF4956 domain-containing protein [Dehalobacter sp.]MDJ0305346.1 DUF4956 domain-containing protein [Dehalobacter sp.]OCZ49985.1 DUF4956 domain-containing protein [Dehalobacter sp. TeCB1]QGZ99306.1 DUF4956 domain-containing protein [Dehalobacter restrictus]